MDRRLSGGGRQRHKIIHKCDSAGTSLGAVGNKLLI